MSDLADLYQEIILDHSRSPRNQRRMPEPTSTAKGDNPLCGDRITIYLKLDDDKVVDVAFEGRGCAISLASASLMTETVKGKTVAEATALFRRFLDLVTGKGDEGDGEDMERLSALSGVREYPMRVKCATLCWHTMASAMADTGGTVTTERPED
jgi:nitrogen fixation NifU-like protein